MQTFRHSVLLVSITLWLCGCGGISAIPDKTAALPMSDGKAAKKPAPASSIQEPAPKPAPAPEYITEPRPAAALARPAQRKTSRAYTKEIIHLSGKEPASLLPSPPPDEEIHSYLVKVEANKDIKMSIDPDKPTSGQLKVWIGQPQYEPETLAGMAASSGTLHTGTIAASARIKPDFPDDPSSFKVKPETSTCQTIDPTGTTALFAITPTRAGQFRVGASVELFKSEGCQGDALTKTANPITVKVTTFVPSGSILEIAWAEIKDFIKEILAALFATIILVFRKRLSKLFGIEGGKQ